MKKNEKLFDAIGQIDERYIAEALEPMYQESVGTSNENKAAMPKKGKLFFYRQRSHRFLDEASGNGGWIL